MIRRIVLCLLITVVLLTVYLAEAQQPKKVPRVGILVNGTPSSHKFIIDEFQQGLRELGYVEGKTLLIEYRYAEGKLERLPELARELVQINVDVMMH
jgi:putative ABC transport system substrate-binding protein